jgi:hypothetical protein
MQKLPEEERRIRNGVSMIPEAWDKVLDHASAREISVSRVIEGLVLALPDIVDGEIQQHERQDSIQPA